MLPLGRVGEGGTEEVQLEETRGGGGGSASSASVRKLGARRDG